MKNVIKAVQKAKAGKKVYLPSNEYLLKSPIKIDKAINLQGEFRYYPNDPNGVFENVGGAKLKTEGNFNAVEISTDLIGGILISEIGVQGNIYGMDTRNSFDEKDISSGISIIKGRIDQGNFNRISVTGKPSAISILKGGEIDATLFQNVNTDGCAVGVYFCPEHTYYARFDSCVIADTPDCGFYAKSNGSSHDLSITNCYFVRNAGQAKFSNNAVYISGINSVNFTNNVIDDTGTFWYYHPTAKSNGDKTEIKENATSLYINGNKCIISNNQIVGGTGNAVILEGDDNLISSGIYDKNIIISGNNNTVNGVKLLNGAKLILKDAINTQIYGVDEKDVIYKQ